MKLNRHIRFSATLAAAVALAACGGGSSGTDPVVVTPPPVPDAEIVTVTGFVTDMPIANATVILSVNGQQFQAPNPTGADGSFQVDIESDDPDALVLCEAFDPNGPARFSALLDNFAGLQEDAGDDGVAEEVNITNVTTAQYLLAQEIAADGSIDSLEELEEVAEQIDPNELLELSAAIKVVVDSVQGTVLPDEFEDVQELAQAIIDETTTFLADIETVNPGILEETIEEVITDGFATVEFAAEDIPGVYVDTEGDDLMVLFADGTGYSAEEEVFQDVSGVLVDEVLVEAVTWSLTDTGSLEIVFTETQNVDTATLLNVAGNVMTVHVSTIEGDGTDDEPNTFSVVRFGFDADGFDAATVPGSYRAEPDEDESETEFTVFLDEGTGYDIDVATGVLDDFFTWEVNDNGNLVMVDDGVADNGEVEVDDETEVVYLLEGSTADTLIILVLESDTETGEVLDIEAFPVDYTDEIYTGPEPDAANAALLQGKTYVYVDGDETGLVTFGENGVFTEIWQEFDDVDGPDFGEDEGEWWVDANGTIYVTFVEADGTLDESSADVIGDLGGDRMVILTDDDGVSNELVLDRVVPFVTADVSGATFAFQDAAGQVSDETVVFDADGTGSYFEGSVVEDDFDWDISGTGKLVLTLDDGPDAVDVFTDNYHKLASSEGDLLNVVWVFRRNGELENDALDPTGAPQVVEVANLIRIQ